MPETNIKVTTDKDAADSNVASLCTGHHLLKNEEYATQYLGVAPTAFTDGIYNSFSECTRQSIESLQEYYLQEHLLAISEVKVKRGGEEVFGKCIAELDKVFDKLEKYLGSNVLNIPEYALLPEDEVHDPSNGNIRLEEILVKTEQIEKNIREERQRRACLIEELKQQKEVLNVVDTTICEMDALHKVAADHGIHDLNESLLFINEHSKILMELVERKKKVMDTEDFE